MPHFSSTYYGKSLLINGKQWPAQNDGSGWGWSYLPEPERSIVQNAIAGISGGLDQLIESGQDAATNPLKQMTAATAAPTTAAPTTAAPTTAAPTTAAPTTADASIRNFMSEPVEPAPAPPTEPGPPGTGTVKLSGVPAVGDTVQLNGMTVLVTAINPATGSVTGIKPDGSIQEFFSATVVNSGYTPPSGPGGGGGPGGPIGGVVQGAPIGGGALAATTGGEALTTPRRSPQDILENVGFGDVATKFALGTGVDPSLRGFMETLANRRRVPYRLQQYMSEADPETVDIPGNFMNYLKGLGGLGFSMGDQLKRAANFLRTPRGEGGAQTMGQTGLEDLLLGPEGTVGTERFAPLLNLLDQPGVGSPVSGFGGAFRRARRRAIESQLAMNPEQFMGPTSLIDYLGTQGIL